MERSLKINSFACMVYIPELLHTHHLHRHEQASNFSRPDLIPYSFHIYFALFTIFPEQASWFVIHKYPILCHLDDRYLIIRHSFCQKVAKSLSKCCKKQAVIVLLWYLIKNSFKDKQSKIDIFGLTLQRKLNHFKILYQSTTEGTKI